MKKVLVTGGTGFIGSHLCETLVESGYDVTAYDQYNSNNSWNWLENSTRKKDIKVVLGDIRDAEHLKKHVRENNIIFHLAALIGIPYSYENPSAYIETNVKGTLNVLNSSRDQNISDIIITSTSEVYGKAQYDKIDEKHPIEALSPYAASKISQDQLSLSFYKSFQSPVKIIRPFNVFGPRQSSRAIIPTIISQILNKNKEIVVGNVHPKRDFTFVKDTCAAFVELLNSKNLYGEIVNVGSNQSITVEELISKIQSILGSNLKTIVKNDRVRVSTSEVDHLHCNNEKILKDTNWKPKVDLTSGLTETIKWIKKNINLYKTDIYNV